jgi:hypothetical protein
MDRRSIRSVLGQSGSNDSSFLTSILDADGDGSMIDDVAGMVWVANKKKGLDVRWRPSEK